MSEQHTNLMTIAFDGRPIEWHPETSAAEHILVLRLEGTDWLLTIELSPGDLALAETDMEAFKEHIVAPALDSLEGCAFPKRAEQALAAIRRQAGLLAA